MRLNRKSAVKDCILKYLLKTEISNRENTNKRNTFLFNYSAISINGPIKTFGYRQFIAGPTATMAIIFHFHTRLAIKSEWERQSIQ